MREVITKSQIQSILTEGRSKLKWSSRYYSRNLDEYGSGIQALSTTQKADPPDQVIDAFRDVQAQEQTWKDLKMKQKHMLMM